MIDPATRTLVIARARNRCEDCQLPQAGYDATFNVDHVIESQHVTDDSLGNLALSCPKCNRKKGPNLAGIDPETQSLIALFHPRRDSWSDHFRWNGPRLLALTATARATIAVLDLNGEDRVKLRQLLMREGIMPSAL